MSLIPRFARLGPVALALWLAGCATTPRPVIDHGVDLTPMPARPVASQLAPGWERGVFMEIFVRAYQDSNGDGIGDLQGLTQRLDYLQALGIKGIWLMPIMKSADRDHGYATTDYRDIETDYGTLADFDTFIAAAHARGIGVIIDYVINHSAAEHPLFANARSGPDARYRNWFVWDKSPPAGWDIWGKHPWYPAGAQFYFGTFGPHMPDFNMRNPEVVKYHEDSLRFWLNRGMDGFRLDAVPHLVENNAVDWNDQPESRALTAGFTRLSKSYPRRYVVCEATAKPEDYASDTICGGAFAFGLQYEIIKAAKGDAEAVAKVADYFRTASPNMATMLSNHDIFAGQRVWDQLAGDTARYKLAAASYLLLPGTPFIYYGEEVGQAGIPGLEGDFPIRGPMSWSSEPGAGFSKGTPFRPTAPNAAQQNVVSEQARPDGLLAFYKAMIALRNTLPAIARGSYEHASVQGSALSYQRRLGKETVLVAINYGSAPASLDIAQLPANRSAEARYPAHAAKLRSNEKGQLTLALAPQSVAVYRLVD
ncbi:alpha-amylase family glycosyl hydrolase [Chitinimonas sp. BJYL2]|uniref:alpha-amylase family glycosyl hydrolase n=1 Tax=Chitinimonas sp. BJYL2 TaxID=2976696 RepID=UPI0022B369DD|nr:alpha-amylase family glycosyl hydrolase [Chitinimonas sp. BJYL2]